MSNDPHLTSLATGLKDPCYQSTCNLLSFSVKMLVAVIMLVEDHELHVVLDRYRFACTVRSGQAYIWCCQILSPSCGDEQVQGTCVLCLSMARIYVGYQV